MFLNVQRVRTKMYGERSFAFYAPERWNSLPYSIRHIQSSEAFKKAIKVTPISSFKLTCLHNMVSEPNDLVSVNVYVSLCVSICMKLYSAVSLVGLDIALYKCTLSLLLLMFSKVLFPLVVKTRDYLVKG